MSEHPVEQFLSGEEPEEWLHLVITPGENKPDYLEEHDLRTAEYRARYTETYRF